MRRTLARTRPDLGFRVGAPSAIRTRDLLLRRHSPDVARRRRVWPDVAFSCTDSGWTWLGVAQYLPLLAPRLAPQNLISFANVRPRSNAVSTRDRSHDSA